MITCGGFTRESALRVAEETGQLIAFGVAFSANVSHCLFSLFCLCMPVTVLILFSQPDLPFRLRENIKLNEIDYVTLFGPPTEKGYTDYPPCEEFLKSQEKTQAEAALV